MADEDRSLQPERRWRQRRHDRTRYQQRAAAERVAADHLVDGVPVEQVQPEDPEVGTRVGSPLDDLPNGVTLLSEFGRRPDWSPDGKTIAFLDASPFGHVWPIDAESGEAQGRAAQRLSCSTSRRASRSRLLLR